MDTNSKKVIIGLSGGVDSSVAAFLLKNKGYTVIGVTLNVWQKDLNKINNSIIDAQEVAKQLGIEHAVIDLRDEFKSNVIDYFANEYMDGKTPNPCVVCNRNIKFKQLIKVAKERFDADFIATGHYAKVLNDEKTGKFYLSECDSTKDQTYALCMLTQEELAHTLMPLGEHTKEEIRKIASDNNLITANKKDSQEICFIEDNDYAKFICDNYNYHEIPGDFIDTDGKKYGKHKGIIHYTIGQRRGLGLSLKQPLYVKDIDKVSNRVILSKLEGLYSNTLMANNLNFMKINKPNINESFEALIKIRYSSKKEKAIVTVIGDDKIKVVFENPVKSITKGQSVVFYDNNDVIGGATII